MALSPERTRDQSKRRQQINSRTCQKRPASEEELALSGKNLQHSESCNARKMEHGTVVLP